MNLDLFDDHPKPDFEFVADWLDVRTASMMLGDLLGEVAWQQDRMNAGGRTVALPRLTAWQGEPEAVYVYSGIRNVPQAWTPTVRELRGLAQAHAGVTFNSVLVNRYRDGNDSIGWHSDNEPELGAEPVIASVSFGGTRTFEFQHRKLGLRHALALTHGSLLIMRGRTQADWKHRIDKEPGAAERLNLTFRLTLPAVS